MGLRLLEVLCYRERGQRRETRLLDMLKFVHRCVFYACAFVVNRWQLEYAQLHSGGGYGC